MKPLYEHDCNTCEYLGPFNVEGKLHDLYYCPKAVSGGTFIARSSSDGPDYGSHPLWLVKNDIESFPEYVAEAYKRSADFRESETTE